MGLFDLSLAQKVAVAIAMPVASYLLYFLLKKSYEEEEEFPRQHVTSRQTVIEVKVPRRLVGSIIGQQGARIKQMQDETGARIKFKDRQSNDEDEERTVVIRGGVDSAQRAEMLIRQAIAQEPPVNTETIFIPNNIVGRVIGKGGETIRKLCRISKAKIQIPNKESRTPNQCPVHITGTPLEIDSAKKLIQEKVEEEESFQARMAIRDANLAVERAQQKGTIAEKSSSHKESNDDKESHQRSFPSTDKGTAADRETVPDASYVKPSDTGRKPDDARPLGTQMTWPNQKGYIEAYVSAVEHPGHFWVQFLSGQATQLDRIMKDMTQHYSSFKQTEDNIDVAVDDLVAAPFDDDDLWYRAQVREVTDTEVDLYYVDFGDSAYHPKTKIRPLRSDFLGLPFQAMEVSLSGVKPKGIEWSEEAIELFETLTYTARWKVLMVRALGEKEAEDGVLMPSIEVIDTNGEKDVNIAIELINQGFAENVNEELEETKPTEITGDALLGTKNEDNLQNASRLCEVDEASFLSEERTEISEVESMNSPRKEHCITHLAKAGVTNRNAEEEYRGLLPKNCTADVENYVKKSDLRMCLESSDIAENGANVDSDLCVGSFPASPNEANFDSTANHLGNRDLEVTRKVFKDADIFPSDWEDVSYVESFETKRTLPDNQIVLSIKDELEAATFDTWDNKHPVTSSELDGENSDFSTEKQGLMQSVIFTDYSPDHYCIEGQGKPIIPSLENQPAEERMLVTPTSETKDIIPDENSSAAGSYIQISCSNSANSEAEATDEKDLPYASKNVDMDMMHLEVYVSQNGTCDGSGQRTNVETKANDIASDFAVKSIQAEEMLGSHTKKLVTVQDRWDCGKHLIAESKEESKMLDVRVTEPGIQNASTEASTQRLQSESFEQSNIDLEAQSSSSHLKHFELDDDQGSSKRLAISDQDVAYQLRSDTSQFLRDSVNCSRENSGQSFSSKQESKPRCRMTDVSKDEINDTSELRGYPDLPEDVLHNAPLMDGKTKENTVRKTSVNTQSPSLYRDCLADKDYTSYIAGSRVSDDEINKTRDDHHLRSGNECNEATEVEQNEDHQGLPKDRNAAFIALCTSTCVTDKHFPQRETPDTLNSSEGATVMNVDECGPGVDMLSPDIDSESSSCYSDAVEENMELPLLETDANIGREITVDESSSTMQDTSSYSPVLLPRDGFDPLKFVSGQETTGVQSVTLGAETEPSLETTVQRPADSLELCEGDPSESTKDNAAIISMDEDDVVDSTGGVSLKNLTATADVHATLSEALTNDIVEKDVCESSQEDLSLVSHGNKCNHQETTRGTLVESGKFCNTCISVEYRAMTSSLPHDDNQREFALPDEDGIDDSLAEKNQTKDCITARFTDQTNEEVMAENHHKSNLIESITGDGLVLSAPTTLDNTDNFSHASDTLDEECSAITANCSGNRISDVRLTDKTAPTVVASVPEDCCHLMAGLHGGHVSNTVPKDMSNTLDIHSDNSLHTAKPTVKRGDSQSSSYLAKGPDTPAEMSYVHVDSERNMDSDKNVSYDSILRENCSDFPSHRTIATTGGDSLKILVYQDNETASETNKKCSVTGDTKTLNNRTAGEDLQPSIMPKRKDENLQMCGDSSSVETPIEVEREYQMIDSHQEGAAEKFNVNGRGGMSQEVLRSSTLASETNGNTPDRQVEEQSQIMTELDIYTAEATNATESPKMMGSYVKDKSDLTSDSRVWEESSVVTAARKLLENIHSSQKPDVETVPSLNNSSFSSDVTCVNETLQESLRLDEIRFKTVAEQGENDLNLSQENSFITSNRDDDNVDPFIDSAQKPLDRKSVNEASRATEEICCSASEPQERGRYTKHENVKGMPTDEFTNQDSQRIQRMTVHKGTSEGVSEEVFGKRFSEEPGSEVTQEIQENEEVIEDYQETQNTLPSYQCDYQEREDTDVDFRSKEESQTKYTRIDFFGSPLFEGTGERVYEEVETRTYVDMHESQENIHSSRSAYPDHVPKCEIEISALEKEQKGHIIEEPESICKDHKEYFASSNTRPLCKSTSNVEAKEITLEQENQKQSIQRMTNECQEKADGGGNEAETSWTTLKHKGEDQQHIKVPVEGDQQAMRNRSETDNFKMYLKSDDDGEICKRLTVSIQKEDVQQSFDRKTWGAGLKSNDEIRQIIAPVSEEQGEAMRQGGNTETNKTSSTFTNGEQEVLELASKYRAETEQGTCYRDHCKITRKCQDEGGGGNGLFIKKKLLEEHIDSENSEIKVKCESEKKTWGQKLTKEDLKETVQDIESCNTTLKYGVRDDLGMELSTEDQKESKKQRDNSEVNETTLMRQDDGRQGMERSCEDDKDSMQKRETSKTLKSEYENEKNVYLEVVSEDCEEAVQYKTDRGDCTTVLEDEKVAQLAMNLCSSDPNMDAQIRNERESHRLSLKPEDQTQGSERLTSDLKDSAQRDASEVSTLVSQDQIGIQEEPDGKGATRITLKSEGEEQEDKRRPVALEKEVVKRRTETETCKTTLKSEKEKEEAIKLLVNNQRASDQQRYENGTSRISKSGDQHSLKCPIKDAKDRETKYPIGGEKDKETLNTSLKYANKDMHAIGLTREDQKEADQQRIENVTCNNKLEFADEKSGRIVTSGNEKECVQEGDQREMDGTTLTTEDKKQQVIKLQKERDQKESGYIKTDEKTVKSVDEVQNATQPLGDQHDDLNAKGTGLTANSLKGRSHQRDDRAMQGTSLNVEEEKQEGIRPDNEDVRENQGKREERQILYTANYEEKATEGMELSSKDQKEVVQQIKGRKIETTAFKSEGEEHQCVGSAIGDHEERQETRLEHPAEKQARVGLAIPDKEDHNQAVNQSQVPKTTLEVGEREDVNKAVQQKINGKKEKESHSKKTLQNVNSSVANEDLSAKNESVTAESPVVSVPCPEPESGFNLAHMSESAEHAGTSEVISSVFDSSSSEAGGMSLFGAYTPSQSPRSFHAENTKIFASTEGCCPKSLDSDDRELMQLYKDGASRYTNVYASPCVIRSSEESVDELDNCRENVSAEERADSLAASPYMYTVPDVSFDGNTDIVQSEICVKTSGSKGSTDICDGEILVSTQFGKNEIVKSQDCEGSKLPFKSHLQSSTASHTDLKPVNSSNVNDNKSDHECYHLDSDSASSKRTESSHVRHGNIEANEDTTCSNEDQCASGMISNEDYFKHMKKLDFKDPSNVEDCLSPASSDNTTDDSVSLRTVVSVSLSSEMLPIDGRDLPANMAKQRQTLHVKSCSECPECDQFEDDVRTKSFGDSTDDLPANMKKKRQNRRDIDTFASDNLFLTNLFRESSIVDEHTEDSVILSETLALGTEANLKEHTVYHLTTNHVAESGKDNKEEYMTCTTQIVPGNISEGSPVISEWEDRRSNTKEGIIDINRAISQDAHRISDLHVNVLACNQVIDKETTPINSLNTLEVTLQDIQGAISLGRDESNSPVGNEIASDGADNNEKGIPIPDDDVTETCKHNAVKEWLLVQPSPDMSEITSSMWSEGSTNSEARELMKACLGEGSIDLSVACSSATSTEGLSGEEETNFENKDVVTQPHAPSRVFELEEDNQNAELVSSRFNVKEYTNAISSCEDPLSETYIKKKPPSYANVEASREMSRRLVGHLAPKYAPSYRRSRSTGDLESFMKAEEITACDTWSEDEYFALPSQMLCQESNTFSLENEDDDSCSTDDSLAEPTPMYDEIPARSRSRGEPSWKHDQHQHHSRGDTRHCSLYEEFQDMLEEVYGNFSMSSMTSATTTSYASAQEELSGAEDMLLMADSLEELATPDVDAIYQDVPHQPFPSPSSMSEDSLNGSARESPVALSVRDDVSSTFTDDSIEDTYFLHSPDLCLTQVLPTTRTNTGSEELNASFDPDFHTPPMSQESLQGCFPTKCAATGHSDGGNPFICDGQLPYQCSHDASQCHSDCIITQLDKDSKHSTDASTSQSSYFWPLPDTSPKEDFCQEEYTNKDI